MIAPSPRTTSFLGLCNTSTHTCDKKHKLSYLWLQDHPWRFRSSTPLMTREGSNFYNTGSWDSSKNNAGSRHQRAFWVQNPRYKRGTLISLWKALKTLPRVSLWCPLNTEKMDHDLGFKRISYGLFMFANFCWSVTFDWSNIIFDRSSLAEIEK